jgi:hypothetical protein
VLGRAAVSAPEWLPEGCGVRRAVGVGVWSSAAAASFWFWQPIAPATPSIRPPAPISITRRDTAGWFGLPGLFGLLR